MRGIPNKQTHYKLWCYQCLQFIYDSDTKQDAEKYKSRFHSHHICEVRRSIEPGNAKGELSCR